MSRLRRLCSVAFSLVLASSLAACGGRSQSSSIVPSQANAQAPGTTNPDSFKTAPATFTFTVPGPKTSSNKRSPKYLSTFTRNIYIQITSVKRHSDNAVLTPIAASYDVNVPAGPGSTAGPPAVTCIADPSNLNNFKCTTTLQMTIGDNTFDIQAWSGTNHTGSKLSEQIASQQIVQGTQNNLNYSLDAFAATMTVSGTGFCSTGPVGAAFGSVGTTTVTFNVGYTDPAGGTIVSPGRPKLSVGTSSVTGGTITVNVNQSTQSFTLTPSTSSVSGTINVSAVQADSLGTSDGLGFTKTKSFTFSTGSAPPPSYLAVVLQTGASGQINFYTLPSPLVNGGADSFSVAAPTTLATTASTNEPTMNDVDHPQDVAFDSLGNLMIANGGAGSPDLGNFACVPAGAIATGANAATTESYAISDTDNPIAIAVGSDSPQSIAIANNRAGAVKKLVEFGLTSNYTEKSSFATPGSGGPWGVHGVIPMPSLTAGTFAFGMLGGSSGEVVIVGPTGTPAVANTASDANLVDPIGIGWDPVGSKLVIANKNAYSSYLEFYNVSNPPAAPTLSSSFLMQPDGLGNSNFQADSASQNAVAVAPDGTVAVSGTNASHTATGGPEIQIYDPARAPLYTIAFDQMSPNDGGSCNTNFVYGSPGQVHVTFLKFLSAKKLLVGLNDSAIAGKQGVYMFDLSVTASQGGVWCGNAAIPAGPQITGFLPTALQPHNAAYKP